MVHEQAEAACKLQRSLVEAASTEADQPLHDLPPNDRQRAARYRLPIVFRKKVHEGLEILQRPSAHVACRCWQGSTQGSQDNSPVRWVPVHLRREAVQLCKVLCLEFVALGHADNCRTLRTRNGNLLAFRPVGS